MANDRGRLDEDDDHGDCSRKPVLEERVMTDGSPGPTHAFGLDRVGSPSDGMGDCLDNDDATDPAMQEIVSVKADFEQGDERVVSTSENDQRNHVGCGQDACPSPDLGNQRSLVAFAVIQNAAIGNVAAEQ